MPLLVLAMSITQILSTLQSNLEEVKTRQMLGGHVKVPKHSKHRVRIADSDV